MLSPYLGGQLIGKEEIDAATRVLQRQTLFRFYGPQKPMEANRLECKLRQRWNRPYALAVSSGTAALHTAISALGFPAGSEIIIPAYTWISVPMAILAAGHKPVVVDIDSSLTLDPDAVLKSISKKTKAILVVHMDGAAASIGELKKIAHGHRIQLLEDCAQAMGATFNSKNVGSFGTAATFSFQFNKIITAGEGGAMITKSKKLWEKSVRFHDVGLLRAVGARPGLDEQQFKGRGLNYRMSEITAAIICAQLKRMNVMLNIMRKKQKVLKEMLNSSRILLAPSADETGENGTTIRLLLQTPAQAKTLATALRSNSFPAYTLEESGGHLYTNWKILSHPKKLAQTDLIVSRSVRIGLGIQYTESDLEIIAQTIKKICH